MAKFKKKHSEPTKGKNESTKVESQGGEKKEEIQSMPPDNEPKNETTKSPPIEDNNTTTPPKDDDPPINLAQQGEKDSKLNKLFWLRIIVATIAGIVATFIFEPIEGEERRWASIAFMIIIFLVTIVIAKSMRIPFALSDRKKLVTQGIGSYVFIYLFMWVFSYTLANLDGSGSSVIPFP